MFIVRFLWFSSDRLGRLRWRSDCSDFSENVRKARLSEVENGYNLVFLHKKQGAYFGKETAETELTFFGVRCNIKTSSKMSVEGITWIYSEA